MDEQPGLTGDERAELERHRAENAVLRAQARRPDGLAVERGPAPGRAAAALAHDRGRGTDRARLCAGTAGWSGGVGLQPGHQHRSVRPHGSPAGR